MNKKGLLYISLAIVFVIFFGLLYLTQNAYRMEDRQQVIANRIHTMDDFVKDIDVDIDRAAFISGFRALLGVEEYLSQKGAFFNNLSTMEEAFRDVFLNGSYNSTSLAIMDNASFNDYLSKVSVQASSIGLIVSVNVTNVTLHQVSPWIIHVEFISDFNISNADEQFWWAYQKNFTTEVSITGLKDPLYTVNTLGRVPNTINKYFLPATGYVNDTNNDTAVLKEFVEGSYYRASSDAPSFLQRFTNNITASPNGVESLVYLPALSDQGIIVQEDRSVVDYLYFSENPDNTTDRCQIQNMIYTPDWFRVDLAHMNDYELDGLSSSPCA